MTIRRMWLWGCVALLCGHSWTWAGKLGDFKKEAVSDSDGSSSEEDDDECGFLCSLLRALLSESDSPVLNLGMGAELAWNYIGVRGGYQRRSVGRVVLAGPTIQLYWRL